jgi:hypothetical protein
MRNFWAFIAEFHQAMGRGKSLTFEVPYQPVAAPSHLTAVWSRGSVRLRWQQPKQGNMKGYNILRADGANGPYTRVNDALHTQLEYQDELGLVAGNTYHYQLRSIGQNGIQSERGPYAQVTIGKDP